MKTIVMMGMLAAAMTGSAMAAEIGLLDVKSDTTVTKEIVAVEARPKDQIGDCEGDPGGADFWAKAAGKAGIPIVGDALIVMKVRNHDRDAKPLGAREREALRPIFGSIVDKVKIVWRARLLDEWRVLGHTFHFGPDSSGQTFGNTVYISHDEPKDEWSHSLMHLVIHEMTHTFQAHALGSLRKFAEIYVRGWWSAGRSYENNWMERQARCNADAEINKAYERYLAAK